MRNNLKLNPSHYKYQIAMLRPNMIPDEEADELVLRVHFYGISSSRRLCTTTVKKMIELLNIAKVLESAYVDDYNSSVSTLEELEELNRKCQD